MKIISGTDDKFLIIEDSGIDEIQKEFGNSNDSEPGLVIVEPTSAELNSVKIISREIRQPLVFVISNFDDRMTFQNEGLNVASSLEEGVDLMLMLIIENELMNDDE